MSNNHGSTTKEVWDVVYETLSTSYTFPSKQEGIDVIVRVSKADIGI